jgi:hypothetical protein
MHPDFSVNAIKSDPRVGGNFLPLPPTPPGDQHCHRVQALSMQSNQSTVIGEFSTFCVPAHHPSEVPTWVCDRWLERVLVELVAPHASATPETWARYYLILARSRDRSFIRLADLALPEPRLNRLIAHIVMLHPTLNQPLQRLHNQMTARQEPLVINFLRHPVPVAKNFLRAYLQPTCWHAARQFYAQHLQLSRHPDRYSLEDCFQMASERASDPARLLQNFQFERPILIRTYAEKALSGILRERIHRASVTHQSTWRLLRYLAKRELVAALREIGQPLEIITQAELLWHCFREIYQTKHLNQSHLPAPTTAQLQQISERYVQRQSEFGLKRSLTSQEIIRQLEMIAQAVQNYRSTDAQFSRLISETPPVSPLVDLIQTEQVLQVREMIQASFQFLPDIAQQTLNLWFGMELSQAEILILLGDDLGLTKQYQLSRQIRRHRALVLRLLLPMLRDLDRETASLSNEPVLDQLLEALDPCLQRYCQSHFYAQLKLKFQSLFTY